MQLLNTNSTSYKKMKKLGEGSFGNVYLARNVKTNKIIVSKEMKLHDLEEETKIQLFSEAKILQKIQHPNIIKIIESYKTKSNKLVLILEFASKGDLAEFIKKKVKNKEKPVSLKLIEKWILQLCLALKHAHDHKIIHRDLKTSNIFLDEQDNLKLGDFGLAKHIITSQLNSNGFVGTPLYLPPECISNGKISFKSDVWALGLILYELCTLNNPFMAGDYSELRRNICNKTVPDLPDYYPEDLNEFILSLLEKDYKKRPSMAKIFDNDYIRDILIRNKDEFEKVMRQTNLTNIEFNDTTLKKDFELLKFYRFSEYKDPLTMMIGIKGITETRRKKESQQGDQKEISIIESEEEESSMEVSEIFDDSPMTMAINKITVSVPQDSQLSKSSGIHFKNSKVTNTVDENLLSGNFDLLRSKSLLSHKKNSTLIQDKSILSEIESTEVLISGINNSSNESNGRIKDDIVDPYMSFEPEKELFEASSIILKKPETRTNKITAPKQVLKEHFKNKRKKRKTKNTKEFDEVSIKNTVKETSDEEEYGEYIDKGKLKALDLIKQRKSIKKELDKHQNKGRTSYYSQYKNLSKQLHSKKKNIFKINTWVVSKEGSVNDTKHIKRIAQPSTLHDISTQSKKLSVGSKTTQQETKFKLKPTDHLINKQLRILKFNVGNISAVSNKRKRNHLTQFNNKFNTLNTITDLQSLPEFKKSNQPIKRKVSNRNRLKNQRTKEASFINRFSQRQSEFEGPSFETRRNTLKQKTKTHTFKYNDVKKVDRKSRVGQIRMQKDYFLAVYGHKFNFIYSSIKKFIIDRSLIEIENNLNKNEKLIRQLQRFVGSKWEYFKGKENVVGLIKLCLTEIKYDML